MVDRNQLTNVDLTPLPPSLTPHDMTLREKLSAMIADKALAPMGFSKGYANDKADIFAQGADFVPGVAQALSASDMAKAKREGDTSGMALATLGMIPGVGGKAKAAEEAAPSILRQARPEAITAVSLRGMPLHEAITSANTERHLIPKKDGGFVGGPLAAQTKADLEMIRQKFDADVAAGASGADWYPRAQEWIKQTAGGDPARQSELARNLALFSAQADPKGNLGFSVKARNNAIMGMTPVSEEGKEGVVRTGQQWNSYLDAFNSGADIPLGQKTGVYADHMDPTRTNPTTGTNDIWHARALGYQTPEGAPWDARLTPQQHAFMDAETVMAVDRANKAGIGGRTDWSPGEIQAAPWVAGKGRGLEESRGFTPEQGLAEASKTYPDYAPSFTGYGTHEMAPGGSTGHLPNILSQAQRDEYSNLPGSWWRGGDGRDALYEAQGAYVQPTDDTQGIFKNEFNVGQTARPLIAFSGKTGERVVEPASRQMMSGTEAFRAMMDAQDAGAWSASIPGQKMSHSNAFEVNGPQSRADVGVLRQQASDVGLPDVVNQGSGRNILTQFGAPDGIPTKQKKAVQSAIPGAEPVRVEGDYIDYEPAWAKGEGSEAVTREMLSKLNPQQEAAFSKPEVRQQVLAKFDRDQLVAAQTGQPVRKDLQTARQIFASEGMAGLRAALGKGILPAAAMTAFLPYLAGSETGTEDGT